MSNRSERREAERLNRKNAYQALRLQQKAATQTAAPTSTAATPTSKISDIQLAANRANAQLSTGPVTPAGRAASSRNALKTGLTGRTVLLPSDDPAEYNLRLQSAIAHHQPATEEELALVQTLVDIDWRLNRAVTLETGIYAKGTIEFAEKFEDESPAQRRVLIQTETYLKYEKSLRNLNLQECRLQRLRSKTVAELKNLIQERVRLQGLFPSMPRPQQPTENGFVFSTLATHASEPLDDMPVDNPSAPETSFGELHAGL